MRVRTPCSSSTGIDLPLDDYGHALISYSGTGTVTWEHGSSTTRHIEYYRASLRKRSRK